MVKIKFTINYENGPPLRRKGTYFSLQLEK